MRSSTRFKWLWHWAWLLGCLSLFARPAAASDDLPRMRVYQQGMTLMLDAQVVLDMPAEMEAILRRGVPLMVTQEAKVLQGRWYWQDAVLAKVRREWTLSYQALTQRWRVMLRSGEQAQLFDDAREAWMAVTTMTQWPIAQVPQLGALKDAELELRWAVDRRASDVSAALPVGDGGAAWRLSTVGRAPVPNTAAPVRDALGAREGGS